MERYRIFPGLAALMVLVASCNTPKPKNSLLLAVGDDVQLTRNAVERLYGISVAELSAKVENPSTYVKATSTIRDLDTIMGCFEPLIALLFKTEEQGNFLPSQDSAIRLIHALERKLISLYPRISTHLPHHLTRLQNLIKTDTSNFLDEERPVFLRLCTNAALQYRGAVAAYLNDNVAKPHRYYESYSAIVAQNMSRFSVGDTLTITAGVGLFSVAAMPKITIDRQNILLNEQGVGITHIPLPRRGEFEIPVRIDFTDNYGKHQTINKSVSINVR